jgi:predicted TPR repeat methyltransferase
MKPFYAVSINDKPTAIIQEQVAKAYEKVDKERSEWLDGKCRELFANEKSTAMNEAAKAKQKATREANRALRAALRAKYTTNEEIL